MPGPRDINVGRFEQKLRAIGVTKGENPIPTFDYLTPTLVLENDRPEWGYAGREFRFMGTVGNLAAGGAANAGAMAILNPSTSGIVAVLEGADFFATAGNQVLITGVTEAQVLAGFAQVVGFTAGNPRDTGAFGQQAGLQLWQRNNAPPFAGTSYSYRFLQPSGPLPTFIVRPGFGYVFTDATLNEIFLASVYWRERPQEGAKGT